MNLWKILIAKLLSVVTYDEIGAVHKWCHFKYGAADMMSVKCDTMKSNVSFDVLYEQPKRRLS